MAERTLAERIADATSEAFARFWNDPPPEFMKEVDEAALGAVVEWLQERLEAAQAEPVQRWNCRCGRATVVSERNGRIAAIGGLLEALTPKEPA